MRTRELILAVALVAAMMPSGSTRAQIEHTQVEALAAAMAGHLAAAFPRAAPGDVTAKRTAAIAFRHRLAYSLSGMAEGRRRSGGRSQ